jgi:hypothetical protein
MAGARMKFRGDDFWFALLGAFGVALAVVAWVTGEDTDIGFFLIMMAIVTWDGSSLRREIGELRYRVSELEYVNEQAERRRRAEQGR